eukprot:TRINITY_DN112_c0_g1_i1.p1 TRINITY_DN112_c0_g1~~TRINITY_DN112_c0_g1_i1.p1  ORF type:complete len:758 (-),score=75.66 TRINITY_DN112_c0_g1_i1:363-2636(-)
MMVLPRLVCVLLVFISCSHGTLGVKLDAEHDLPGVNISVLQQKSHESEKMFLHSVVKVAEGSARRRKKNGCKQAPKIAGRGAAACKAANMLANSGSFGAASKLIDIAAKAEVCNRDYYDRGAGWTRNCRSGWSKSGLMCYPSCPRDGRWRRAADHCWQDCPGGYKDEGAFCARRWWGGWRRWLLKSDIRGKRASYKPAKSLISHGSCSGVPHRPEDRAGLCYQNPRPHYKCSVTMCHMHCNSGQCILTTECGLQCINGGGWACFAHVMNILVDLTNAVIKSTLLVLSMGTAAAATSASGSMMTALKNTAKKKMKMLMKNVRNGHFKKWVKSRAKKYVKDKLKEQLQMELESAIMNEVMTLGGIGAEEASEGCFSKMSRGEYRGAFETIDPTGIVKAVGATMDNAGDPTAIARAWLSLIATFDPTGWAAVAVAFTRPGCIWLTNKMEAEGKTGDYKALNINDARQAIGVLRGYKSTTRKGKGKPGPPPPPPYVPQRLAGGGLLANGVYALKGGRSRKWCADEGHRIICNRGAIGGWERFTIRKLSNGRYSLKGGRNQKFCADEGHRVICNRGGEGPWEQFTLQKVNKYYAFKGGRNGKWCADDSDQVKCNRGGIGGWEKFTLQKVGPAPPPPPPAIHGTYALKGGRSRKWCADEGHRIICNRGHIYGWEKFTINKLSNGKYSLKGGRNQKFCADEGHRVICNRGGEGPWEQFTLQKVNKYYAFKGGRNGKWCADDSDQVKCNRGGIGGWEKFTLQKVR